MFENISKYSVIIDYLWCDDTHFSRASADCLRNMKNAAQKQRKHRNDERKNCVFFDVIFFFLFGFLVCYIWIYECWIIHLIILMNFHILCVLLSIWFPYFILFYSIFFVCVCIFPLFEFIVWPLAMLARLHCKQTKWRTTKN